MKTCWTVLRVISKNEGAGSFSGLFNFNTFSNSVINISVNKHVKFVE